MQDLLVEAGTLFLVGMSVVFVFLTMLIGGIRLITAFVSIFPEEIIEETSRPVKPHQNVKKQDHEIVAAISAAVVQYRKDNGK